MIDLDNMARGLAEKFAYLGRPIMRPEIFEDDIKSALQKVADDAARQMREDASEIVAGNVSDVLELSRVCSAIDSIPLPSERKQS